MLDIVHFLLGFNITCGALRPCVHWCFNTLCLRLVLTLRKFCLLPTKWWVLLHFKWTMAKFWESYQLLLQFELTLAKFQKMQVCTKVQMDHFCGSTSQVSAVWAVLLWIWFMNGPHLSRFLLPHHMFCKTCCRCQTELRISGYSPPIFMTE